MIGNVFLTIVFIIIGLLVSYVIVQLVSKFYNKVKEATKKADDEGRSNDEVEITDDKPLSDQLLSNPKGFMRSYTKKVQSDVKASVKAGVEAVAEKAKYKYYGHHYDPSKANLNFPDAKPLALKLYTCLSRFDVYGEPAVIISKEIAALLDKMNVHKDEKDTIISIGISVSVGETLKDKFNRIDINSNGVISIDEMSNLFLPSKSEKIILNACGVSFYKNWKKVDYLVKQAMKVADLNKDSQIDFNEFRALYMIKLLEFYQQLNPKFNASKAIKN
jgi:Ca2+-binding EF-hand superfamily protein